MRTPTHTIITATLATASGSNNKMVTASARKLQVSLEYSWFSVRDGDTTTENCSPHDKYLCSKDISNNCLLYLTLTQLYHTRLLLLAPLTLNHTGSVTGIERLPVRITRDDRQTNFFQAKHDFIIHGVRKIKDLTVETLLTSTTSAGEEENF